MLLDILKMWHRFIFVLPLIISVSSIRVPVDNIASTTNGQNETESTPTYYIEEHTDVDSYLVPPDPPTALDEDTRELLGTPATYLVPPAQDRQSDYYVSEDDTSAQTDWLPILQVQNTPDYQRLPLESIPILFKKEPSQFVPVPSTQLSPPSVDAVNEFFLPNLPETNPGHSTPEHYIETPKYVFENIDDENNVPTLYSQPKPREPVLHLTPPRPYTVNKLPTKLYPKKYTGTFKTIPIPLAHSDDKDVEPPKAKPAKYLVPQSSSEVGDLKLENLKDVYYAKKAEHKRKVKGESEKQHADVGAETYGKPTSSEQETSETNFRYPGRPAFRAPVKRPPPTLPPRDNSPAAAAIAPASDGRTEFRMHGMKGPHSYQFGYDTGKGKNRQFRYEERDNDGIVKGHYGYVDKLGKLRVVNYSAHPEYGFRAEEPVDKEQ